MKFKNEPIWLRANYLGKYNDINFRVTYREHTSSEDDNEIVKTLEFNWLGRIPQNSKIVEEGVKALFSKRVQDGTIGYNVVADGKLKQATLEEELALKDVLVDKNNESANYIGDDIDEDDEQEFDELEEEDEDIQEGFY